MTLPLICTCALLATRPLAGPGPQVAKPATCAYATQSVATRQLFQQIDQALPQVVRGLRQDSTYQADLPYVEVDSCFRPFAIAQLFVNPFVPTPTQARLQRHLLRGYYKKLDAFPRPSVPQWANIEVLEYASAEAAGATKQVLDSLVATCQGRNQLLEPCVAVAAYRFTQVGACLVRFNLYSQDPLQRRSLRALASRLPLVPPRRAPAAGHTR